MKKKVIEENNEDLYVDMEIQKWKRKFNGKKGRLESLKGFV